MRHKRLKAGSVSSKAKKLHTAARIASIAIPALAGGYALYKGNQVYNNLKNHTAAEIGEKGANAIMHGSKALAKGTFNAAYGAGKTFKNAASNKVSDVFNTLPAPSLPSLQSRQSALSEGKFHLRPASESIPPAFMGVSPASVAAFLNGNGIRKRGRKAQMKGRGVTSDAETALKNYAKKALTTVAQKTLPNIAALGSAALLGTNPKDIKFVVGGKVQQNKLKKILLSGGSISDKVKKGLAIGLPVAATLGAVAGASLIHHNNNNAASSSKQNMQNALSFFTPKSSSSSLSSSSSSSSGLLGKSSNLSNASSSFASLAQQLKEKNKAQAQKGLFGGLF